MVVVFVNKRKIYSSFPFRFESNKKPVENKQLNCLKHQQNIDSMSCPEYQIEFIWCEECILYTINYLLHYLPVETVPQQNVGRSSIKRDLIQVNRRWENETGMEVEKERRAEREKRLNGRWKWFLGWICLNNNLA